MTSAEIPDPPPDAPTAPDLLGWWSAAGGRGRQLVVQPPYPLRDRPGRASYLVRLTARAAGWDTPMQVWHGPPPAVPAAPLPVGRGGRGEGEAAALARSLAATSRPRTTVLIPNPVGGAPAPAGPVVEAADHVLIPAGDAGGAGSGGLCAAVWTITGWPAATTPDWARPLTDLAHHTVLHARPVDPPVAQRLLRRRLAALASTRLLDDKAGRLDDPASTVAAEAAGHLRDALARGQTRLLHVQLLLVLMSADPRELAETGRRLADLGRALLVELRPLRLQHRPGWEAALPGGQPLRWPWRLLDAATLASSVPLPVGPPTPIQVGATPGGRARTGPGPVLVGIEPESGAPLSADRWAEDNHSRLVVGTSGAGKSYAAKLELMRQLVGGVRAVVVDPEGEFGALCETLGGLTLQVGEDTAGLDPVGLATRPTVPPAEGLSVLATWAAALLGGPLGPVDLALLDRALAVLRADQPGPDTSRLGGSPLAGEGGASAADLLAVIGDLAGHPPFTASDLPARLAPAAGGTVGALFAPNPALADPPDLVCFDLRGVAGRIRPAVMAAVLAWTWTRAVTARPPRELERTGSGGGGGRMLLVVDEAHLLLDDPPAAELLAQFARRARKYSLGLEVVTQRLSDFLDHPAGRAVLASTATKLLLGAEDHERAAIARGLGLTDAEVGWLQPGHRGRGLLISTRLRSPVRVVAGPAEHQLASAPPRR